MRRRNLKGKDDGKNEQGSGRGVENDQFWDSWFMGSQPSGPEVQVTHTREGKVERQLHPDIAERSE